MIIHWVFLVLVLWTVPSASLSCYKCLCTGSNITACECIDAVDVEAGSHCTIIEDFHSSDPYIEFSSASLNSSYIRIKDPYYIIADESIYYNETTGVWNTKTKRVVHGCDWDNCNKWSLLSSLPDSFKLTIDTTWLNDNIYGDGSVTSCHTCENEICGNATNPANYDSCPFAACDNSTTCSLSGLWQNIASNASCYLSRCTPPKTEDEFSEDDEKYKVQVEAIVYLSQNRSNFEIWELNVNCAVYNCTRSTIIQEITQRITGDTSDLTNFPTDRPSTAAPPTTTTSTLPLRPIRCYNCSCSKTPCPCTTYEITSSDNTYCHITRSIVAQDIYIDYGYMNINPGQIRDYPYVLVEESIIYNEASGIWITRADTVVYGCNQNLCNKPDFVPYLPTSFQMRLPELWLNSSILGTGQPVRDCHECPDDPVCSDNDSIDASQCPVQPCNTTCLLSDKYNDPANTQQCYQSFCGPPDSEGAEIDKYRVEITGILYASRPTNLELREIDIYCRADNCSRPEIFRELRNNLILQIGDVTIIFNQTVEEPKIRCFECDCQGEADCTCDTVTSASARSTYCTITRNYDGENVYIYFRHSEISSSYANVRELPFVIVEETIYYDNVTGRWITRTNEVIYGCNWDYCNKPSLLPVIPSSFQMSLSESWLNASILGTEQPVHNCHECAADPICSSNNTFNGNSCPVEPCNTTCYVSYTNNSPTNNQQCYLSSCVPNDSGEFTYDTHRVEIQGIVYASQPNRVELWEVYLYCRVDNCSRPEIFQEIKDQLIVQIGNLSSLFNQTSVGDPNQLRCYDCYCFNDPNCACNTTLTAVAGSTFCTIIREYYGQDVWLILEHIDRNSTLVYIREFPFMLVDESIAYNEATGRWITTSNLVLYGCNWDFCNDPRLIPRLPNSFQMRLSEAWLNTSVLGTGQPLRDCHECPDAPQCGTTDFLDASRCPIRSCNTTCLVSDTFNDPANDLLCYQSFCAPPSFEDFDIDPHRVEIEGILYGNLPSAQVELWEVDIYCRADDCSRPEIFKELQAELSFDIGDLSAFFNITTLPPPPEPILSCYDCACYDDPLCSCTTVQQSGAYSTHCSIVRVNYPNGVFTIDLEPINRNSTRVYIRKFPYLLAEESILYNETTRQWSTRTNILVYGCNWHLCNHPSLVTLLPNSFKMTLSDEWLNKNVLDNGTLMRDCHQCPEGPQCGTTSFLDVSRCPVRSCNNTCIVSDLFNDPSNDQLCFQSYCSLSETDDEEDRHRVELEGIIYGDQPKVVELWEIDLYCRADDCSRPEIFDEIRSNLTLQTNNITNLLDNSSRPFVEPQLICYENYCYNETACAGGKYTVRDAKSSYCTIVQGIYGNTFDVVYEHIDRNSTRVYIREFPYLLVEEAIIYNDTTGLWNTRTNLVVFGCNWNYCNDPTLAPYLPDSFQMRLPAAWLNSNVLGTGQPIRNCHECSSGPVCSTAGFIDGNLCPITGCNTTCLVSDLYDDPDSNQQCYQSFCAPPDSELFTIDPHRVEMEGILYLYPIGRRVELWEIDVYCRADDCSRPTIFDEIREQFTETIGDLSVFYNITPTPGPGETTTVRSTVSTTRTTTTVVGSTTTRGTTTTPPPGQTTTTPPPGQTTTTPPPGQTTTTPPPGQTTTTTRPPGQTTTTTTSGASTCMTHIILLLFYLLISLITFY